MCVCLSTSAFASSNHSLKGTASWYGDRFHGNPTASGERFNQNALTAAHPSLPFGTKVKVTNLRTKKSVVVRINDRGPYAKGRIIDVSKQAAKEIGLHSAGLAPVQVQVVR
ncbi:hypothetical protein AKN94_05460 [Thiopseudomonas alkaliphila]|nr:hypothetical protein AKN94_05460 [Thiopseudomonas alkaliphila]AKX54284.1 hypothetical protein AKN91_10435 [Thiopseudomonas alkaliphila]AKX56282.1 hypothetical protein AKN90_04115 [Thiopseudomonas alkaliphila]